MKKGLLMFSVLFLVLLLSGCGNQNQEQNKQETKNQTKESRSVISSIKDAMGLGKTMKCTYKVEAGENSMEMVAYVKGEKYRSENEYQKGKEMKSVFDGKTLYSWNEGEKNGFKITKECTEELAKMNQNQEREINEPQSVGDDFEEAMDVNCEEASDVDFSVPSDVEFQDQCEIMKDFSNQAENMMKKYQGQMPGGAQ